MLEKRDFSETAQWFLRDFQTLLDDFAKSEKIQIVVTNKKGDLVTKVSIGQDVCKLIMAIEEGKTRCGDFFKTPLTLIKNQKKPVLLECYAGFASVWMPIIVRGTVVGMIGSCGARYDKGESREDSRKRFSKLADDLGIMDKERFLRLAIDEVKIVTEQEIYKRAEKLNKLLEILAETAQTPLKEIFG